jgi:hypothetical protein
MTQFELHHLRRDQMPEAYPLVRMIAPAVTPEQWLEYSAALLARGGGVLGVFAGDATLHGIATYTPEDCLRYGRVLRIENLVTFELNRGAPARQALCEGLELLGSALGCAAVVISVWGHDYAHDARRKCLGWSRIGLAPDGLLLAKRCRDFSGIGSAYASNAA